MSPFERKEAAVRTAICEMRWTHWVDHEQVRSTDTHSAISVLGVVGREKEAQK